MVDVLFEPPGRVALVATAVYSARMARANSRTSSSSRIAPKPSGSGQREQPPSATAVSGLSLAE
ncbi:hypothetical protein [Amycolatopsis thermoflava]|uniref:hypothetical protein n=1 Tax=Amycolatopsis thermoflava TaxID=84480 RepID=UPI00142EBF2F|nr:hypothetical protein [Amycolatopsis thermoflava]